MKILLYSILIIGLAKLAESLAFLELLNRNFTARFEHEGVKLAHSFGKNPDVVMSGFSLLQPFAQMTLASRGSTHDELMNVLGSASDSVVESAFKGFNDYFETDKDVVLRLGNKVYVSKHSQLNASYADYSRKLFGSEFENMDFSDANKAADEINKWVAVKTNHNIKDLVKANDFKVEPDVFLVNTVYFKGEWKFKFNKNKTTDYAFYYNSEDTVQKPFMVQENYFKNGFSDVLDSDLLEMSYNNSDFYFIFVLPKKVDGLPELLKKLKNKDASVVEEAKKLQKTYVNVILPLFKIDTYTDLKPVLQNLGVKKLFEANHDNFKNLLVNNVPVKVDAAVQRVFINVDEYGTEAAAANYVDVAGSVLHTQPVPKFLADHPFYFQVNKGGYTLFSGTINFDQGIKE